jgi:FAD/FMN-containing dehydrogenase/ferredoxin
MPMSNEPVGRAIYGKGPPSPPGPFSAKEESPEGALALELLRAPRDDLRIVTALGERMLYSRDQSEIPRFMKQMLFKTVPEVVAQPLSTDAVVKVLKTASAAGVPVVPRGSASSPFGGCVPVTGGLVLDMSGMDRIVEIDPKGRTATVQAGVRWADLDHELEKQGLRVGTCPSSKFSTVGGWIATGGFGINSLSRGHLRDSVLAIEFVTSDGTVRKLSQADPQFPFIFGSEGQLGVVTSATIEVLEKPTKGRPHLVLFDDVTSALSFANALANSDVMPTHIVFESASKIALVDRAMEGTHFRVAEAVLFNLEGEKSEAAFEVFLKTVGVAEEKEYLARYLWNERFFPMKIRKFGPGMLGAELVMPLNRLPESIEAARKLCANLDIEPLFEVVFLQDGKGLVLCFFTTDQGNTFGYTLDAFKSLLIARMLVDEGGKPYSIGIWNHSFLDAEDRGRIKQMRELKSSLDRAGVMNPGKFFVLSGRFGRLGGLVFHPRLMGSLLRTIVALDPMSTKLIRRASKFVRSQLRPDVKTDALKVADECAMCGACVSVCPAYLMVGDERVTARGKLMTAKAMAGGMRITKEHAHRTFLCIRCKACEQVCQSKLELIPVYESLEKELESIHGKDAAEIERFVKFTEASPEFDQLIQKGLVVGAPKNGMGGAKRDV